MNIEEMRKIKDERGYSIERLSKYSGVPAGTIVKIFNGQTKSPRKATLYALERVLSSDDDMFVGKAKEYKLSSSGQLRVEQPLIEATQGFANSDYTVDDYLAIPNWQRYELMFGRLIKLEAPLIIHQSILLEFCVEVQTQIDRLKGKCIVLPSPTAVQILSDDSNMLEPDVIIVCESKKIKKDRVFGAPDFVLEILSPSTAKYDLQEKRVIYLAAGVKEYWIIDPKNKALIMYSQKDGFFMHKKELKGSQKIGISKGLIEINLDKIKGIIEKYN